MCTRRTSNRVARLAPTRHEQVLSPADRRLALTRPGQVLSADLSAVYDCLFANEALLDKLFSFLKSEVQCTAVIQTSTCDK